jgi:hypothetical protein
MAKASWSYRDKSDEMSSVELNIADVSAGGADFDTVVASIATLGAAIAAVSECVQATEFLRQVVDTKDPATPTDVFAQRESAARIFYADDTTGEVYHISIPGPDWDTVELLPNTDLLDMTEEPIATLIAAIESDAESRVGNSVTVLRAVAVGRHN